MKPHHVLWSPIDGRGDQALKSSTNQVGVISALMAAALLAIAWSLVTMFPVISWIPRIPEPYHEPAQSLAMFVGMAVILHVLLWKHMTKENTNKFRCIDYVWFLGAAASAVLGVIQFQVSVESGRLADLQFEATDAAITRESLQASYVRGIVDDEQRIHRNRSKGLAQLREICLSSYRGKEFREYCEFVERENIVAACIFPHLYDPRSYDLPRPIFSENVFLGFEEHDRTAEIHTTSNLPDHLRLDLAIVDQSICQGAKQEIGLALVLRESSRGHEESDLGFGRDGFEISKGLDGDLTITSATNPTVKFSDLNDVLYAFGRWSEEVISFPQPMHSDTTTDFNAIISAPDWYHRATSIQQAKQQLRALDTSILNLKEQIETLLSKRRHEASLRKVSPWWYVLLPAFIALRVTRTTAEIRAASLSIK